MPPRFQPITPASLDRLRAIVGAAQVFVDLETLKRHGADETEDLQFMPQAVVAPRAAREISAILRLANENHFCITTRGGGTGLSGAALPVYGGLVIAMRRFNEILDLDARNLFMVVEPGVTTQCLQEAAAAQGLFYPPDPASRGTCFIGGNVAMNSGGPRAVKYGVTKDFVYGLEVVFPNGDIVTTGGKLLKNVSGYNLTQLLVGSEGTLGVITKITLKLIPAAQFRRTLLAAFRDEAAAATAVTQIFHARITPSACEFMERAAARAVEEHLGKTFPNRDAAAQLLIEVDGNFEAALDADIAAICEICEKLGAYDIVLAENRQQQDELWSYRRAVGVAVKSISTYKEEDTVVPRAELPRLVRGVREIVTRYGLTAICYGHAGDGNLHVNILKNDMPAYRWETELPKAIREIFECTVALGGTISGEHGIGYSQKEYLPIACSPAELAAMRALKQALDPNGILNPGKIFMDATP